MATLRPSDQLPFFDVQESSVNVPGAGVELCGADAERVVLLLGLAQGNALNVALSSSATANSFGVFVQPQGPLIFTQSLHGPLVAKAWFGGGGPGTTAYVLEVFLRRFPKPNLEGLAP